MAAQQRDRNGQAGDGDRRERRSGRSDRDGRRNNENKNEYIERVVTINRVSKVVKGGRRFSFTALVVVGDGEGTVGVGYGKAKEVPQAISKGVEEAKKNFFRVPMIRRTITHLVEGRDTAGIVLLRPAAPGTGVMPDGGVGSTRGAKVGAAGGMGTMGARGKTGAEFSRLVSTMTSKGTSVPATLASARLMGPRDCSTMSLANPEPTTRTRVPSTSMTRVMRIMDTLPCPSSPEDASASRAESHMVVAVSGTSVSWSSWWRACGPHRGNPSCCFSTELSTCGDNLLREVPRGGAAP